MFCFFGYLFFYSFTAATTIVSTSNFLRWMSNTNISYSIAYDWWGREPYVCVYYVEAGDNSMVVLIDLQNSSKCRLLLLFLLLSPTAKKFNTSNERWGRNCISDGKLFAINIIPLQPPYMPHSRFHIETGTLSWATGEMDKNIPTADKDAGVFFLSWRIF